MRLTTGPGGAVMTTADFKEMIPSAEYTKKLQLYRWTSIGCNRGLNKPRIHMKRDQATKKIGFYLWSWMEVQNLFADICSIVYSHWPSQSCQTDQLSPLLKYVWLARADRVWINSADQISVLTITDIILYNGQRGVEKAWNVNKDDFSPLLSVLHFAEVRMIIS